MRSRHDLPLRVRSASVNCYDSGFVSAGAQVHVPSIGEDGRYVEPWDDDAEIVSIHVSKWGVEARCNGELLGASDLDRLELGPIVDWLRETFGHLWVEEPEQVSA